MTTVCVIGAGMAGLTTSKVLREHGLKPLVLEQSSALGGTWRYHSLPETQTAPAPMPLRVDHTTRTVMSRSAVPSSIYKSLVTNLSTHQMQFTDYPFPESTPLYPTHAQVCQYLEDYAAHFGLHDCIRLQHAVEWVERIDTHWKVQYCGPGGRTTSIFDAVCVCNGHFSVPYIPYFPSLDTYEAHPDTAVSHSHYYRDPSGYKNKSVLVVGSGFSALDIGSEIAKHGGRVSLSVRRSEAETLAQLHKIGSRIRTSGRDFDFSFARLRPSIADMVADPNPRVLFTDGSSATFDYILFCTGYRFSLDFLPQHRLLDPDRPMLVRHLYKHLLYTKDPTLSFIGVVKHTSPFPVSEVQAHCVARVLQEKVVPELEEEQRDNHEIEDQQAYIDDLCATFGVSFTCGSDKAVR